MWLFALAGALLIAATLAEVLWTILGLGGGLVTRQLSTRLWRLALRLHRRLERPLLLTWAGILIVAALFASWVLLFWCGWTLVFLGEETAVVSAETRQPADFFERVYFTGFTISTLGTGEYVPNGKLWQLLTTAAALTGLFLVTITITYLVPVVQAAKQKRRTAIHIASLGLTPQDLLLSAWDGSGCQALTDHLRSLADDMAELEQLHLTYPVLHFLHTPRPEEAAPLAVSVLDEALTILEHGVDGRCGVPQASFDALRGGISRLLATLGDAHIEPAAEPPPAPQLAALREAGMPLVEDARFAERLAERCELRRRLLVGFVRNEGWSWERVHSTGGPRRLAERARLEHLG